MNKDTLKQLERLWVAEIDAALNNGKGVQLAKKTADKLEREGLISRVQQSIRDRLGTFTWETHVLTHAGRWAYCETCRDEPEPADAARKA